MKGLSLPLRLIGVRGDRRPDREARTCSLAQVGR